MILTGENQSSWRKTCPCPMWSARKPTWCVGWNPGLHGERPATNCLSEIAAFQHSNVIHVIFVLAATSRGCVSPCIPLLFPSNPLLCHVLLLVPPHFVLAHVSHISSILFNASLVLGFSFLSCALTVSHFHADSFIVI
jgi:hypothetical protein